MIEMENLLPKGISLESLPEEHQKNLNAFLPKLQEAEKAYGKDFVVTSGYRTLAHHFEIYKVINDRRALKNLPTLHIPMSSNHLSGHAVDIEDTDRSLAMYMMHHPEMTEGLGFYFEALDYTKEPSAWLHIQDVAPKSGNRFFIP